MSIVVTIRLQRMGAVKQPHYRVVVCDSRKARKGGFIEIVGYYNPMREPAIIDMKKDRIEEWVSKGARLSSTVKNLLVKI
ncbi:MAG: 30S ribosomal protein S16 [Acidobacteriota bacterium]